MCRRCRRGVVVVEVLAVVLAVLVLASIAVTTARATRTMTRGDTSLANLQTLGLAQDLYALDWNGRQFTNMVDELASFGPTRTDAFNAYHSFGGGCSGGTNPGCHPPALLGYSSDGVGQWGYWMNHSGNYITAQPIGFAQQQQSFGIFRLPNVKPMHDYVDGRVYSPTYFAPADAVPYEVVEPYFDDPGEFVFISGVDWSSYCFSPAAMYHPDVMRAPSAGGWVDPWSLDDGVACPALAEVLHPALKTRMMEHHWTVGAPAPCNPEYGKNGTYDGCEPWYFNQGIDATPAALFFDGSTRRVPNTEVQSADQRVMKQTETDGLWSRDTPFGADGYFLELAFDPFVDVSHHILTTDGVRGRDTLGGGAAPLYQRRPIRRGGEPRLDRALEPAAGDLLLEEGP